MARKCIDVYNNIIKIAPEELVTALQKCSGYWPKEGSWFILSKYVNEYIKPNSKDPQSIAIYAELCDCTPEQIKARFQERGL